MIRYFSLVLLLLIALSGCKQTKSTVDTGKDKIADMLDKSPTLLTFDNGETVSKAEFERVYAKNNGGQEAAVTHTTEQLQEYLDLYVKFKRKVFAAEAVGLDTTPSFQQEFESYRKQLVQPYLSAKEVEDQLVQEAYDRSGYLVSANHILLMANEDASPADTLAAYNKIQLLRDSIMNGSKSFEEMAVQHSQDPSAKTNKGSLGYFTAFDMVYPFETAAFSTPVSEVSAPVRTRFGYHIVKVNDKIKREGTKTAAHIIVRIGDRYSAKTEEQAEAKIKELHARLQKGEAFADLAREFSDDPNSASRGGDLGTGRLLPEMENLKNQMGEGDFSEPFKTRFGWHILAISDVEKRLSFEEARPSLRQRISRDTRSQLSRKALIARIKQESDFRFNDAALEAFQAAADDRFPRGGWKPDSAQQTILSQELFSLDGGKVRRTLQDLADDYMKNRTRRPGMTPAAAVASINQAYVEKELLQYEEDQLPQKNPEYRNLLQEYRDGILLFTLMEQKVWKKAVEDTSGLQTFFAANEEDFRKNTMVEVVEYRSSDKAIIDSVVSLLAAGKNEGQIDSMLNATSALSLRVIRQTYEEGKDEVDAKLFSAESGYQTPVAQQNSTWRIMISEKVLPAGIPPMDKVKSEAITKYQDYLEKQWLDELAGKYPVKTDESVFATLFK
ncbi:MAG: peptidylprolyl isomerase [Bacteroidota bacterium]